MRRFSRLAGLCLLAAVVTGSYNAWVAAPATCRRSGPPSTVASLAVKLLLVLGLVGLGAVNRYAIVPRLGAGRRPSGIGERLFRLARLVLRGSARVARAGARRRAFARTWRREAVLVLLVFAVRQSSSTRRRRGTPSHAEHSGRRGAAGRFA